ncbi:MAG: deoxyguanosinetriphosphate triphosphohydrolase [Oscillospiraceae bacterium]|nr:deoxyguanosinetriphosphate triphosphohydrolase [Oscillospiraceae bacterium]
MTIREQIQQQEKESLSPQAVYSQSTRGREKPEEEDLIRTPFQRDRDRIIHCGSFRRLMHKTQVFFSPQDDHCRTRLTHTLEVAQIARTIARALRLNEDLTEAIALGHDLGHTPFGHAGERALNEVCPQGYRHYQQSVRVVETLEKGGQGLNLCWEVRDGIRCHTAGPEAATLEGRLVRFSDKIAYMNHDVDDAVRSGVMTEEDLPWEVKWLLGRKKSQRITALVGSVIENSKETIAMDPEIHRVFLPLQQFLFETVYTHPLVKNEEEKAQKVIKSLYEYFIGHGDKLPSEYRAIREREGIHTAVCDYISGMSDRFAVGLYTELFIPKGWQGAGS